MGRIRDRIDAAHDAVDEAVHHATDKVVRCPAKKGKLQCMLNRHKRGKHRNGNVTW